MIFVGVGGKLRDATIRPKDSRHVLGKLRRFRHAKDLIPPLLHERNANRITVENFVPRLVQTGTRLERPVAAQPANPTNPTNQFFFINKEI